jgi:hypothetical protein
MTTGFQAEPRSTMPADIEEGTQLAVTAAHDKHALSGELGGLEVPRIGKRIGTADAGPHLAEQA